MVPVVAGLLRVNVLIAAAQLRQLILSEDLSMRSDVLFIVPGPIPRQSAQNEDMIRLALLLLFDCFRRPSTSLVFRIRIFRPGVRNRSQDFGSLCLCIIWASRAAAALQK
jgi:hypothetical protein